MTGESPTSAPFGTPGGGRRLLLSAAPLAAAIGVFGVIFGAGAQPYMDVGLTLAMSLLVFSGTLQFATVSLLAGGADALAIVVTAIALNTRHVVLGAVLRPRLDVSRARRAVLAWFMIDESFGLALTAGQRAAFVLVTTGALFFLAWQAGTLLGVLGAQAVALAGLASAIFPVLFIGLAAITVRDRSGVKRVIVAAVIVIAGSLLLPQIHQFVPIIAALLVALPGLRD